MEVSTDLFRAFAFYAGLLIVKVMIMSFLTSINRFSRKAFANPEDIAHDKRLKVNTADPDVERVRRAHLNDLENVIPFLIVGLLYIYTSPAYETALLLFRVYAVARFLHTFVYAVYPVRQPARAIAWFVGIVIQFFMAFRVISYNY